VNSELTGLHRHQPTADALPLTEADNEVLTALKEFAQTVRSLGVQVTVTSPKSLVKLPTVPPARKKEIVQHYQQWRQWIIAATTLQPTLRIGLESE
jgi:hypothetical protein